MQAEDVRRVIRNKFVPITQLYKRYYSAVSWEDFERIIAADTVSTNLKKQKLGKYAKWLLHIYLKGNLRLEDLPKVASCLSQFDELCRLRKLKKNDIFSYSSFLELRIVVDSGSSSIKSNSELYRHVKSEEAERLFEDELFVVIHPLTQAASCIYGSRTCWCTAARKDCSFDSYNSEGELYIVVNKQTNRKYQFHFESDSFANEMNEFYSDSFLAEIGATHALKHFFSQRRKRWVFRLEELSVKFIYVAMLNGRYGVLADNYENRRLLLNFEYERVLPARFNKLLLWKREACFVFNYKTSGLYRVSEQMVYPFEFREFVNSLFPLYKRDVLHFFKVKSHLIESSEPPFVVMNRFTFNVLLYINDLAFDTYFEFSELLRASAENTKYIEAYGTTLDFLYCTLIVSEALADFELKFINVDSE